MRTEPLTHGKIAGRSDEQIVISGKKAKQAQGPGRPVFRVLVYSIGLAVIAGIGLYIYYYGLQLSNVTAPTTPPVQTAPAN